MKTYMMHLRWAHRFLRLPNTWDTEVVRQVCRGRKKLADLPRERLALQAQDVRRLVRLASDRNDIQQCAMLTVGRLFLLRMPSECLP